MNDLGWIVQLIWNLLNLYCNYLDLESGFGNAMKPWLWWCFDVNCTSYFSISLHICLLSLSTISTILYLTFTMKMFDYERMSIWSFQYFDKSLLCVSLHVFLSLDNVYVQHINKSLVFVGHTEIRESFV